MAKAPEAPDLSLWHPELLAGPLRSKRLTVLYGPPGPWRDGMVRRGLMPQLRQSIPSPPSRVRPRRRQVPIRFDGWGPLPLQALRTRVDAEFSAVWPQGSPETLAAHLRAIGRQHHATVLLVLDAFERHLHEPAQRHDIERFDIELSECITHEGVPVHVLIVVDELENRALQRYTRWIANFGEDILRLPGLDPQTVNAGSPWHDTDILAPPEGDDDEPVPPSAEGEWPVDLALDLTPTPAAVPSTQETRSPPKPVAAPFAESEPMPWVDGGQEPEPPVAVPPPPPTQPPPPPTQPRPPATPSSRSAAADQTRPLMPSALDFPQGTAHGGGPGGPREHTVAPTDGRTEPTLFIDPAAVPPANGSSYATPRAPHTPPPAPAASTSPFGAWPAPDPTTASPPAPRPPPPWLSNTDVEQMRRMQERPSRWPGLLGLAIYLVVLLTGAWFAGSWIIDSQRVETRPPPLDPVPAAPATATPAPAAAPPFVAAPTPAAAGGLSFAWPPESGSAGPLADEMIRRVATPAGVALRRPAANESPALTLMRTDALMAARASNTPLQIVSPLYSEQVQVLVRTDARWDFVREIRGLRLNIGRADGARARTARALYQQLFGVPLPAVQANELDVDGALSALQQRGGPIDAIIVVSESPIEAHLQPAVQRLVRELTIDGREGALPALPGFAPSRRTPNDRARLSTTTYLVATGTPPRPHDGALRALAVALCRAQPQLQKQDSPLLRGFKPNQQPDVGYGYVLPRTPEGTCPQT